MTESKLKFLKDKINSAMQVNQLAEQNSVGVEFLYVHITAAELNLMKENAQDCRELQWLLSNKYSDPIARYGNIYICRTA